MFQLTTEENEIATLKGVDLNLLNLSIIDLADCKNLLKERYFPNFNGNISFIILKHENITSISSEKSIQYEIYEPFNHTKLDISICQNSPINIHIPTELSESNQKLIEELNRLGYNVFDINDPFYTDFCAKYTTKEGTDITLEHRKKYIYEDIMSEVNCQENCEFSSYDPDNNNIECKCKPESYINTVDSKKFSLNKLHNTFYDVLKYSNYKVLQCYKLAFNKNIFGYNKGFWIIFILFILYCTQLIIYIFKKISPFQLNIARYHFRKQLPNNLVDKIKKNYEINTEKNYIPLKPEFPPKKRRNINGAKDNQINEYDGRNTDKNVLKDKLSDNLDKKEVIVSSKFSNNKNNNSSNKTEEKESLYAKLGKLDNFELNNLEYEDALILDQRNFWQIYWSLLKRENILLFTFYFHNDYNLYYAKNARFIFLLATDMAMNVFFFADETMNKLYLSYGEYDFVQQIPQIVYS